MENHINKEFIKINSLYNFNLLSSLIQLIIDRNSNNIRSLTDKYYFLIQLILIIINLKVCLLLIIMKIKELKMK